MLSIITTFFVILLSWLVYRITSFYRKRKDYPPGPFPLPFIGNWLLFRRKEHYTQVFEELTAKYGPVFTFFMGSEPQIFVYDKDLSLEVMKRDQFAGRPHWVPLKSYWLKEETTDISFGDYNKEWDILRKTAHSALRKYAGSDQLPQIVCGVVDEAVGKFKEISVKGEQIDVSLWLFRVLYSILAQSTFGMKYKLDDPELNGYIESIDVQQDQGIELILFDFLPYLKYILREKYSRFVSLTGYQFAFEDRQLEKHIETFDGVTIRDFTDALLMAKEAETAAVLSEANIAGALRDLFNAGSDTSKNTLLWAFLFMSTYPEYQRRMRKEIEDVIGDSDIPTVDHRAKCHLTTAFIAETLRLRHVVPLNMPHKTVVDTNLGGHEIKAGMIAVPFLYPMLLDKKEWGEDAQDFIPERFLDSTTREFISRPNSYYLPFSAGRRTCPGEKVALANMFIVLARFLQQTKGYEFVHPNGPGSVDLSGNPGYVGAFLEVFIWVPHKYKLILKPCRQ